MEMTPDEITVFTVGGFTVNATIVFTWIVMAILTLTSILITRNLRPDVPPNRWRTTLEAVVLTIQGQINEISARPDRRVLYFAGTLFLFIFVSNLLAIVPGWHAPTGSLSTTAALALAVLVAVPLFGIASRGIGGYLRSYIEPNIIMLPFNIIGEFSRGVSLAIRLYGNVMSGAVIAAILLGVAPFFFPVIMDALGLLTGVIQAYIFAILATVYISSATEVAETEPKAAVTKDQT
ncbi:F0F1 ATP synthase subunit A [Oceaniglobus ichthyenteri]|uniref:F0F1 ATP synthase subunit A n=1 Tax=Oceaniglobus ichthyenteri TaxID=2136177 RepID=UPI000D3BEAF1|nr:F0F1 ATP synthase subunit A [Oceaniglobus ichthyenteri]